MAVLVLLRNAEVITTSGALHQIINPSILYFSSSFETIRDLSYVKELSSPQLICSLFNFSPLFS